MSHTADSPEMRVDAIVGLSSGDEVLDGNVFHDLHESLMQPAAVAALYRKFAGNAAAFIAQLRNQGNEERIDTLHTLKGSAAMMGATRMAKLAMRLQTQVQDSSVPIAPAIEELEGELLRFRTAAAVRLLQLGVSLEP